MNLQAALINRGTTRMPSKEGVNSTLVSNPVPVGSIYYLWYKVEFESRYIINRNFVINVIDRISAKQRCLMVMRLNEHVANKRGVAGPPKNGDWK